MCLVINHARIFLYFKIIQNVSGIIKAFLHNTMKRFKGCLNVILKDPNLQKCASVFLMNMLTFYFFEEKEFIVGSHDTKHS